MQKHSIKSSQLFKNTKIFAISKLLLLLLLFFSFFSFLKTSPLEDFSDELSALCEKTLPAVVMIKVYYPSSKEGAFDYANDTFFKEHFPTTEKTPYSGSLGSGFFIQPNGYIITCCHVVDFPKAKIQVVLHNGEEHPATLIGTDPRIDLAVLKIEGTNFHHLNFGDSDKLKIGSFVFAIGTPLDSCLQSTITFGFISAKGRRLHNNEIEDFLQTDAAINPGNSGGPLVSLKGTVIGINSNIMTSSTEADNSSIGLGLAVTSNLAQRSYQQIIDKQTLSFPFLGLTFYPLKHYATKNKVRIAKILPGSPAEKAGLKIDDQIIECNNIKTKNIADFRNQIYLASFEDKFVLTLIRDQRTIKIKIQPENKPDSSLFLPELSNS